MALFIRLLALPAALHRATIYRALSPSRSPSAILSHCYLFVLFFCFLVGTSSYFSPSLCWCLAPERVVSVQLKICAAGEVTGSVLESAATFLFRFFVKNFFLAHWSFWSHKLLFGGRCLVAEEVPLDRVKLQSNFSGSWSKAGTSYLP